MTGLIGVCMLQNIGVAIAPWVKMTWGGRINLLRRKTQSLIEFDRAEIVSGDFQPAIELPRSFLSQS